MTSIGKTATGVLVLFLLAIHLPVLLAGGPEGIPEMFRQFGLARSGFSDGRWWQLLTYGFLHGNLMHLGFNVVVLWVFGRRCERVLGIRGMMPMWLSGAIGGGMFHLAFGGGGVLVGASGMACATILAWSASEPYARLSWLPIQSRHLGRGIIAGSLLLTLISRIPALPGWLAPEAAIGHACHLGGAVAGYWVTKANLLHRRKRGSR